MFFLLVRGAIKTTDKDIAKTALLAKGFREAGQTAANAFRTFADKPEVDYSQKEQKHPITKAVLAPMKAVKKMLVSMELHLDASIDKLDNLAMNVKLDKEKHMENMKKQEQTEPERAEAERVEAEVVYSKKGRRISPTSSKLSGFIFPYLRYFLMCRFLLHLIHTSSLKCICIILILLRLSDHWRVYNLCFHSLCFSPF